jgi:AcrR family transcriptional regulator
VEVAAVARNGSESSRPSRREAIIDHAIAVFARQGFQGTSIQDVATATSIAPTAVYYHFSSKDELFDAALSKVLSAIDEIVETARPRPTEHGDDAAARTVFAAVWDWVEQNPEAAQLLYHQLPGATQTALVLRREFEERHITRAVDYLPTPPEPADKKEAAARWAIIALATRSVVALGMNIHSLRMSEGPLAEHSPESLRSAYLETSGRILRTSGEHVMATTVK